MSAPLRFNSQAISSRAVTISAPTPFARKLSRTFSTFVCQLSPARSNNYNNINNNLVLVQQSVDNVHWFGHSRKCNIVNNTSCLILSKIIITGVLWHGWTYFGNSLLKAPTEDAIVILIMYTTVYCTWFDLSFLLANVSGHFDARKCIQASK